MTNKKKKKTISSTRERPIFSVRKPREHVVDFGKLVEELASKRQGRKSRRRRTKKKRKRKTKRRTKKKRKRKTRRKSRKSKKRRTRRR